MSAETAVDTDIRGQLQSRAIAALADRQHGVVAARQLLGLGLARGAIDRRVQARELHVWYRGVYAVGHRVLTREGRWMAAVLSAGPGAVLSHRSAAALWGVRPTARMRVEITAPRRSRYGIEVHQARLARDEVMMHDGIPVTTPARTLVDLAAVLRPGELTKAVNEAEILRLPYPDLSRHKGHRGIRALRTRSEPPKTRSELERDFIAFLDAHDLPTPLVNAALNGKEPDFRWAHHKLIAELDGFASHGTRHAFEHDRARDRRLLTAGWRVIRITYRQLHEQPDALAADLAALLPRLSAST